MFCLRSLTWNDLVILCVKVSLVQFYPSVYILTSLVVLTFLCFCSLCGNYCLASVSSLIHIHYILFGVSSVSLHSHLFPVSNNPDVFTFRLTSAL